jgi:hypothetical protein
MMKSKRSIFPRCDLDMIFRLTRPSALALMLRKNKVARANSSFAHE